jgi:uncharacterized protein
MLFFSDSFSEFNGNHEQSECFSKRYHFSARRLAMSLSTTEKTSRLKIVALTVCWVLVSCYWVWKYQKSIPDGSVANGVAAYERKDYLVALKELRKPAEKGNAQAQYKVGRMYAFGEGVAKDLSLAQDWYRKAAEQQDVQAQIMLGGMYANGEGVPKDLGLAAAWYRKAAEQQDVQAQTMLGWMYANGEGVPKDLGLAAAWYRKAALLGDAVAQQNLGWMYQHGQGINRDHKGAVAWYRMSAEQGRVEAQMELGWMYENGDGVKDVKLAAAWYRKAAEHGLADAQHSLGLMYQDGKGVAKDIRVAVEWFQKSAEQGYADAQQQIGRIYYFGKGVPKNSALGADWLLKAASQGDSSTQYLIGLIFELGDGLPRNKTQAYFWYLLASAQGVERAMERRDELEMTLSVALRNQMQTAASNWKPSQPQSIGGGSKSKPIENALRLNELTVEKTGTGFAVSRSVLVTNAHVVSNCGTVKVNGQPATVSAMDAGNDLALINTNHVGDVAKLSSVRIRQGDPIVVVGFPLRGFLANGAQVTAGNISALAGMGNDSRFIQISAPVQTGNSGGPLVNISGNVVGVVVSKLNAAKMASITGDIPQNVNFAISPLVLQAFLEANGVRYESSNSSSNLSSSDVVDVAKKFTSLIECYK